MWCLDSLSLVNGRSKAFTKEDNRQLQVIMKQFFGALTGLDKETPFNILLKQSGHLSVQQLTAYHSLTNMYKTMLKKPVYLNSMMDQNRAMLDKTRLQSAFHPRYIKLHQDKALCTEDKNFTIFFLDSISTSRSVKTWIKLNIPALHP